MVNTNLTQETCSFEKYRQYILRNSRLFNDLRTLKSVCESSRQLSRNDITRLIDCYNIPHHCKNYFINIYRLPWVPEDSEYDSDETIGD